MEIGLDIKEFKVLALSITLEATVDLYADILKGSYR